MRPSTTASLGKLRRLGIIGDVHADDVPLAHALQQLEAMQLDAILCTGDVVDGPGSADHCAALLQAHQVITVAGNHERWLFTGRARHHPEADQLAALAPETLSFLGNLPTCVEFETVSGRLLLSHGIGLDDMAQVWPGSERLGPQKSLALDEILASQRYRYLVHGHIHYRLILEFERMTLVNPGALARNLQMNFKPGFMTLDAEAQQATYYHLDDEGRILEYAEVMIAEQTRAGRLFHNTQEFDSQWDIFRIMNHMKPAQQTAIG